MRWLKRKGPARRAARRGRRRFAFALPQWTWPAVKLCAVAGFAALAVGGPWALWRAGAAQQALGQVADGAVALTGMAGLVVEKVVVEGQIETRGRDVLAALDVRPGMPILAVDPRAARERLERIPWVKEAAVERRMPGIVQVRLVERVPMALWQHAGRFVLIDRHGAQIETHDVGRFNALPHIVGEDAGRAAGELLRMLAAEPALQARVTAAVRVGGRRWNLRLDSGQDVMLPEENAAVAWSRLAELEREQNLLARDLKVIDMRLPDRMTLKLNPSALPAPPPPSPQKKT
ncbi:MAG: cell division protein FtsQ/DivIB [Rhodospirillales bacterium]